MRLKRFHLFLLGGLMLVVIGPVVFSQPEQSQGRQGGTGRTGRPRMSPDAFWDQIAPGKDSVNVTDLELPPEMQFRADRLKGEWLAFLQKKGITTGVMTRALYLELSEEKQRDRESRRAQFQNSQTPPVAAAQEVKPGKEKESDKPAASSEEKDEDAKIEEEARRWFTTLDHNKDGVLDREETRFVPMLRNFDRYDLNLDGRISVEEFIEAYRDDQGRRGRGSRVFGGALMTGSTETPVAPAAEERRSVVYRVGKLPKELPQWFAQLDRDMDGQVGLYEWKAAGRSIKEFLAMDANRDGFLTAEEVLRYQKARGITGGPGSRGVESPNVGVRAVGQLNANGQGNGQAPATVKLPERLQRLLPGIRLDMIPAPPIPPPPGWAD